ncbi:hypothetical protein GGI05_002862, partial [Coemansia sp. RSA 2603]
TSKAHSKPTPRQQTSTTKKVCMPPTTTELLQTSLSRSPSLLTTSQKLRTKWSLVTSATSRSSASATGLHSRLGKEKQSDKNTSTSWLKSPASKSSAIPSEPPRKTTKMSWLARRKNTSSLLRPLTSSRLPSQAAEKAEETVTTDGKNRGFGKGGRATAKSPSRKVALANQPSRQATQLQASS